MTKTTAPGGTPIRTMEKTRARVDDLRPHPRNPRKITSARLEQLQRTLESDPGMLEARPLIALPDGTVVAGNQRLAAAMALGWETVPVVFADLSEAEVTRWMLLDNRGFGEDDRDAVAALLGELEAAGADLALTGYDVGEIDSMLRELHRPAKDPDDAPPAPADPVSVRGEVYELGPHRLMCGDATDQGDVAELVAAHGPVEAIWTDPPYGVEYVGKTSEALRITNDTARGLPGLLRGAFTAADSVLAAGARFYVAAPPGPLNLEFRLAIKDVGWRFHEGLVWVKDAMVLGHSDYHLRHEDILYGWKPGQGRVGRGNHPGSKWYGGNAQTSIFDIPRPKRSADHPTMKPVELVEAHLENSTRRGDTIIDPFGGSGTTLIAAERLGLRALAMELDPGYCDVIRQRYADYTNQPEYAP